MLIGPAGADEHGGGAEAEEEEAPEAEEVAATAAADDSDDDSDSSTGIAVAGLVAGLLGLGAGGLALVRSRKPANG